MSTSLNGKTIAFLVATGRRLTPADTFEADDLPAFFNTLVGAFTKDKSWPNWTRGC